MPVKLCSELGLSMPAISYPVHPVESGVFNAGVCGSPVW